MNNTSLFDAGILIADDEDANVVLLHGLLSDEGYRNIRVTCDSREVLALVEAQQPDLILLDLHMPHMSGFDVMRELRERLPPDTFLPILVLTADVTPQAKERALAGGARDFLTKPFDALEVSLRIRNLLEVRQLHLHQAAARAAAERAERRAVLLASVSRVLATSFDYHTTLTQLARLLVPHLGELCAVTLHENECAEVVGIAHTDVDLEQSLAGVIASARAEEWLTSLLRRLGEHAAGTHTLLAAEHIAGTLSHPRAAELVHALQPRTALVAPLAGTAGRLGTLLILNRTEAGAVEDDIALAEEVAYRAAVAVENARLYHEAQRATHARDEMLGFVAHDLRNPLNVISMTGEMLLETLVDDSAAQRRPLQNIIRSAATMNRLIEDLLEVQRLDTHGIPIECTPIDLSSVLRQAAELLAPLAQARRVALVSVAPDLPRVSADASRLHQVISNLVGNAIKFTPADGRIEITAEVGTGEAIVHVRDNGPGIPAEQLPHIFSRFWQGRNTDRRGIGLGLAIARGIVTAHGGRIWVESSPGAGATFSFAIPLAGTTSRHAELVSASPGGPS
jgi:signal transduction histidine kinase/DNA-binding response OmpR family regulator